MMIIGVLLISLVTFIICDPLIFTTPVFIHGENNYPCIRIPAIIQTGSGKLLAFAECRRFTGDGCNPSKFEKTDKSEEFTLDGRICMKSSTDSGRTWSSLSFPAGEKNKMDDPEPVWDDITKSVVLFFHMDEKLVKIISNDEGNTWTSPVDHSDDVKPYGTVFPGPSAGIQKQLEPNKGRLLWIGHYGAYDKDVIWYSDDNGATVTRSATVLSGMDEAQLVELNNGTVLANLRTNHKFGKYRANSISVDGGTTWSAPYGEPKLIEPVCQASIIRDQQTGSFFFSNPHHTSQRVNMTIQRSDDNCETWSKIYSIDPTRATAYSCLTNVPEKDAIGLLWESSYEKCSGTSCVIFFSLVKNTLE